MGVRHRYGFEGGELLRTAQGHDGSSGQRRAVLTVPRGLIVSAVAVSGLVLAPDVPATVRFEQPTVVVERVGTVRSEQGIGVELASGAGRALVFSDTGTLKGLIAPALLVRGPGGRWTRPRRVSAGARVTGNAAGDVVVAGLTGSGAEVRFIRRGEVDGPVEQVPGTTRLHGAPGVGEDGSVALIGEDPGGAFTVHRRGPGGGWAAHPMNLAPAPAEGAFSRVLRALPEPDGTTRVLALLVVGSTYGLLHARVHPDGSLTEDDFAPVELHRSAVPFLAELGGRLPSALLPGGGALIAVPDMAGPARDATSFRLLAYARPAGGSWRRSVVTTQPFSYPPYIHVREFGAGVALGPDGTAAIAYGTPGAALYVRRAGAASWGKRIHLQALDTDAGSRAIPGLALAGSEVLAAWGANPFLIGARGNRWSIVERRLAAGPQTAAGSSWPTVLAGLGPVAVRSRPGPVGGRWARIQATVTLARGPAPIYVALDPCTPGCRRISDVPELAIRGRVGRNRVRFTRRLVPGRYRLRVYTPGPNAALTRSRQITVR